MIDALLESKVEPFHSIRPKTTPRAQQKREKEDARLEDESGTLGLLVTTKLEVLASLEGELLHGQPCVCRCGAQ